MSTVKTGFFWDERCFWHGGGNYALMIPVGGHVQPMIGGLPENPETKRRLKNLMDVTGLMAELASQSAPVATEEQLRRVHPQSYLDEFQRMSAGDGGELGVRTPFGPGGYEIAAASAGLAIEAFNQVLNGTLKNAYSLSRPPGHHCLPDTPMGFCLLANIPVAIEEALANKACERVAVIDWDVHHGNGTEAIYYDRDDVLTISIHQENCFPRPSGDAGKRGDGKGEGYNINVPLLPGGCPEVYSATFERIVEPAIRRFKPDAIIVACGFDAGGMDPLARMLLHAPAFAEMTKRTMALAAELCGGKLLCVHEGGYNEVHVPFCGHAVIQTLAGSSIEAPDPMEARIAGQRPDQRLIDLQRALIGEMSESFGL